MGLAGVEGQGQSPEAVSVAVLAPVGSEANVAGGRRFLLDGAEVGPEGRIGGDAQGVVLEGGPDGVSELLLDGAGELDTLDAVGPLDRCGRGCGR